MFVGHSLLAFALVAAAVRLSGGAPERALRLGAVAGAFAAVPDVDILYALAGLAAAEGGPLSHATAFWSAGNVVHRGVTHSAVVAVPAAVAAGAWLAGRGGRTLAVPLVAGLAAAVALDAGPLSGLVTLAFGAAALGVAAAAGRVGLGARATAAAAFVGLASHPFGDLFTGEPPAILYPLDATLVAERVALSADPTLHLLGAFGAELAAAWAALAVGLWLADRDLRSVVDARAAAGVAYAAGVLVVPAPTLDLSYPFVFSVLAVGGLGAAPRLRGPLRTPFRVRDRAGGRRATGFPGFELPGPVRAAATGLTAVTVAWLAYGLAYALL